MREIKFRAWNKETKEMVEWIKIWPEYGWLVMSDNDAMCERGRDPEGTWVLMQYTGLKDKNGTEIYEGDIVHIRDRDTFKEVWTVEMDDSVGKWSVYNQLNSTRYFDFDCEAYDGVAIVEVTPDYSFKPEVIGNIYEDKELLDV